MNCQKSSGPARRYLFAKMSGAILCALGWLAWGALPLHWCGFAAALVAAAWGVHFTLGSQSWQARVMLAATVSWASLCTIWGAAATPAGWPSTLWAAACLILAVFGLAASRAPDASATATTTGIAATSSLSAPAAAITAASLAVGLPLLAVAWVLYRAGCAADAKVLLAQLRGLACGGGFCLWYMTPVTPHALANVRLHPAVLLTLALLGCGRLSFFPGRVDVALPAWRQSLGRLAAGQAGNSNHDLADLLRLQAVGARDAAYATVALALTKNAAPATLRPLCPRGGWPGPLPAAWGAPVAQGRLVCRALAVGLPEASAAFLAQAAQPELVRLQADLLAEAGDMVAAAPASATAAAAKDPYAAANLRVAQALRAGRPVATHPPARGPHGVALWDQWNAGLELDDWGITEHRGLVGVDTPGQLRVLYEPQLGRTVLAMQSVYGAQFGVQLPSPPAEAPLPAALALYLRGREGMRLEVTDNGGHTQIFDCATSVPWSHPTPSRVSWWPLPTVACLDRWAEVVLPLRPSREGTHLVRIALYGDFWLASVRAVPARPLPLDPSADTGGDLGSRKGKN